MRNLISYLLPSFSFPVWNQITEWDAREEREDIFLVAPSYVILVKWFPSDVAWDGQKIGEWGEVGCGSNIRDFWYSHWHLDNYINIPTFAVYVLKAISRYCALLLFIIFSVKLFIRELLLHSPSSILEVVSIYRFVKLGFRQTFLFRNEIWIKYLFLK